MSFTLNIKVYHNIDLEDDDGWVLVGEVRTPLNKIIRNDVEYTTKSTNLLELKSDKYKKPGKIQVVITYTVI